MPKGYCPVCGSKICPLRMKDFLTKKKKPEKPKEG
jgi:hypothetical protein